MVGIIVCANKEYVCYKGECATDQNKCKSENLIGSSSFKAKDGKAAAKQCFKEVKDDKITTITLVRSDNKVLQYTRKGTTLTRKEVTPGTYAVDSGGIWAWTKKYILRTN